MAPQRPRRADSRPAAAAAAAVAQRVDELEAQVAVVARLHQKVALCRPSEKRAAPPLDDWRRNLVAMQQPLDPGLQRQRGLRAVGTLRASSAEQTRDAAHTAESD